jgi:hypothetical protein
MTANIDNPGTGPAREARQDKALRRLVRIRWATRFTLAFGVAASGVANVLHAQDNPISRAISAWPPLALLLSVELISRVPATRLWRAVVRLSATGLIASIAGWISYWHMAAVTAAYGETGSSAWLLPLTVDGLVVVASISLVELTARIRDVETIGTATEVTAEAVLVQAEQIGNEDRSPVSSGKASDNRPQTAPAESDGLVERARQIISGYKDQTGRDITRDELRERLRVKTETASYFVEPPARRRPG